MPRQRKNVGVTNRSRHAADTVTDPHLSLSSGFGSYHAEFRATWLAHQDHSPSPFAGHEYARGEGLSKTRSMRQRPPAPVLAGVPQGHEAKRKPKTAPAEGTRDTLLRSVRTADAVVDAIYRVERPDSHTSLLGPAEERRSQAVDRRRIEQRQSRIFQSSGRRAAAFDKRNGVSDNILSQESPAPGVAVHTLAASNPLVAGASLSVNTRRSSKPPPQDTFPNIRAQSADAALPSREQVFNNRSLFGEETQQRQQRQNARLARRRQAEDRIKQSLADREARELSNTNARIEHHRKLAEDQNQRSAAVNNKPLPRRLLLHEADQREWRRRRDTELNTRGTPIQPTALDMLRTRH